MTKIVLEEVAKELKLVNVVITFLLITNTLAMVSDY